jgi:hypothetical protein
MRRGGPRARVYARYAVEVLLSNRWNSESVGSLSVEDLRQLRENAVRLGADEVAGLCDSALIAHGSNATSIASSSRRENTKLVPRRSAFRMLGVHLTAGMSSWGGVRKSDGMVVLSLWADDVRSENGGCSCLLWARNRSHSRPWSDTFAGKERLEHCKLAVEKGEAEGFLVHGVRLKGVLPEARAHSVEGVDPAVIIRFQVVQRGSEYWALWGSAAAAAAWK